jgi:hypothetical protein
MLFNSDGDPGGGETLRARVGSRGRVASKQKGPAGIDELRAQIGKDVEARKIAHFRREARRELA